MAERHLWPSHLQADLEAACQSLEQEEGNNHDEFAVSLHKHATVQGVVTAIGAVVTAATGVKIF